MRSDYETLIEGDVRPAQVWQSLLGLNNTSFSDLVSDNILRKLTGSDGLFRMDFVGLISGPGKANFILPKVFDPSRRGVKKDDIAKVLRCIQRFERRNRTRRPAGVATDEDCMFSEGGTLLNLFLSILGWTRDHGLHSEDRTAWIFDPAHVDWGETLERGMASHLKTGLAFADLYGRDQANQHDKLALAQSMALTELFESLGIVAELWVSEYDPIIETCHELLRQASSEDRNIASIRLAVQDADLHATRDHERVLISSLRQWIEGKTAKSRKLNCYGVNAFHVVWEDMCDVALDAAALSHKEIASQPFLVKGLKKTALGNQFPDLLLNTPEGVVIADAKWYRVWRDEFPGSSDVMKQLMYELSVDSEIPVLGNAFVVPIPDTKSAALEFLGGISMEGSGLPDERFPSISVIGVRWDTMVDSYLSSTALPEIVPSLMLPRSASAATVPHLNVPHSHI